MKRRRRRGLCRGGGGCVAGEEGMRWLRRGLCGGRGEFLPTPGLREGGDEAGGDSGAVDGHSGSWELVASGERRAVGSSARPRKSSSQMCRW